MILDVIKTHSFSCIHIVGWLSCGTISVKLRKCVKVSTFHPKFLGEESEGRRMLGWEVNERMYRQLMSNAMLKFLLGNLHAALYLMEVFFQ